MLNVHASSYRVSHCIMDLEFSVGSKPSVWEVKGPTLAGQGSEYTEDVLFVNL